MLHLNRARNSCLETAGGRLVCLQSRTTLAQEGVGLEKVPLPDREEFPTGLLAPPATPVAGEVGGGGVLLSRT
jgi:hypothetical protein